MIRDFSGKKKEELYWALDGIDDREWKSFMVWCGGRSDDFREWVERLDISFYTRQIDNYQNEVLRTNDSTREQIDIIFENVAETDRRYAETFSEYAEAVKEQMARVSVMTEVMRAAGEPEADIKAMLCNVENQRNTRLEYAERCLDSCLEERGYTNSIEREFIVDMIRKERPDLLEELYSIKSYNVSFWEIPMGKIEKHYSNFTKDKHPYYKNYYIGKYLYPSSYIEGIIKAYETHKIVDGRFVLDNRGRTIAYGHEVAEGEDFSKGLSLEEGLELALDDLDERFEDVVRCMREINELTGMNIDIKDFSENEVIFLVDFRYNRGRGLVERPEIPDNQPHSSLALLIIAISEGNDEKVISILKEEVNNEEGEYYEGLERRRMDEYEILKKGDYERDYDMERGVW